MEGVALQGDVELQISLGIEFAPIGSCGSHFAQYIVANKFVLLRKKLSAKGYVVFVEACSFCKVGNVWQTKAKLMELVFAI